MTTSWRTVRVFISSTFKDMQAERDHLVRIVFPELRERMATRRLHLVDVDLRWGVTEEEAEHGKVLEVVLEEIARSRPFFIGILGARYGSVLDTMSPETALAHPWLSAYAGHSLTALEIAHGVLRHPDLARRSFFYFRDPQFIGQVPESKRADYLAEDMEAARKVAALKDEIRASGRPVLEDYPCTWDNAHAHLTHLDLFGQRVLDDLWTAICAEYPEEEPEPDVVALERQMHEAFAEERARLHIGRQEQAARLAAYVQGADRRPAVITGESGCGKSGFLASWCRRYATDHPEDLVLAYFIGASPASTIHWRLLRHVCVELQRLFHLNQEIPQEEGKLSETLANLLSAAAQNRPRIVMVVDGLDQLSPLEGAHGLGWLLGYIPQKVRLVVSTLEGSCLDILRRQEAEEIVLPPLVREEQRQIVQVVLQEWRRKLDDRQMGALLSHPGAGNPLYLRVALEELRFFGSFDELTARIQSLAPDVAGLFDQVLVRLEEDHGYELVSAAFALVGCSRHGLKEVELLDLLRRGEEKQLPRALWARLARGAKAYLVQRGELIDFFHGQLREAVAARYLTQEKKHAQLAAYFAQAPVERKVDEYPYQLQHAEDWPLLAAAVSDLCLLRSAGERHLTCDWVGYWRSLSGRYEPVSCYEAAMKARVREEGETESVAGMYHLLGSLLCDMAKYDGARLFHRESLRITKRIRGRHHPEVAAIFVALGRLYYLQGKSGAAQSCFRRALRIYRHAVVGEHAAEMASCLLMEARQSIDPPEKLRKCRRALQIYERACHLENLDVARVQLEISELLWSANRRDEALPLCERALAARERLLGPNHPDTAAALVLWAMFRYQVIPGSTDRAISAIQRALTIQERVLDYDHPQTAYSLGYLGLLYFRTGKVQEAVPLLERAAAIHERTGTEGRALAESRRLLAKYYFSRGQYGQAVLQHFRLQKPILKALWRDLSIVPTMRPGATLFIGVFSLYVMAQRAPVSLVNWSYPDLLQRAIEAGLGVYCIGRFLETARIGLVRWRESLRDLLLPALIALLPFLGRWALPIHPPVTLCVLAFALITTVVRIRPLVACAGILIALVGTANLVQVTFTDGGADDLGWAILSAAQILFGGYLIYDSAELFLSQWLNRMAGRLEHKGNYRAAVPLYRWSMRIGRKLFGESDSQVARYLNALACLKCDRGDYAEAVALHQRALGIRERIFGPDHPQVAASLNNIGLVYWYCGDYDRALPLYERALSISERSAGPGSLSVATHLNNLGDLYRQRDDYEKSLALHQRALAIREHILGPDHVQVSESLNNLGVLYYAQQRYADAVPLYERALAITQRAYPPEHPEVALRLHNLGDAYRMLGKYADALPLLEHAARVARKKIPKHPYAELYRRHLDACREAMQNEAHDSRGS